MNRIGGALFLGLATLIALIRTASAEVPPSFQMPQPPGIPVSFVAKDSASRFQVTVGQYSCATPCALPLFPGPAPLEVQTSRHNHFKATIDVDPRQAHYAIEKLNRAKFVLSTVLAPVGTILLISSIGSLAELAVGSPYGGNPGVVAAEDAAFGVVSLGHIAVAAWLWATMGRDRIVLAGETPAEPSTPPSGRDSAPIP